MPITVELDESAKVWRLTPGESFDLAEIMELTDRTEWKNVKSFLWDLRNLTKGPDTSTELREAVDLTAKTQDRWAGSRVAILVARDLDFGIARMFGAFADELNIAYRAFREEDKALEWLTEEASAG